MKADFDQLFLLEPGYSPRYRVGGRLRAGRGVQYIRVARYSVLVVRGRRGPVVKELFEATL